MPDGDVLYHKVGRDFIDGYKALYEGFFTDQQVADKIASGLRSCLRRYGNQSITLICQTFDDISGALATRDHLDAADESLLIDDRARDLMGHRRGMSLATDACKDHLLGIMDGANPGFELRNIVHNYVMRVLEADLWERMPLINGFTDVEAERIAQRIARVRPLVEIEVNRMVKQITSAGRVDGLSKIPTVSGSRPDFSEMAVNFPEID